MAQVLEDFYNESPVGGLDQNRWDERLAEVQLQFQQNSVYTPLVPWKDHTNAQNVWETELIEADTDAEEISMTLNYINAGQPFDSRMRKWVVSRYGKTSVAVEKYLLN